MICKHCGLEFEVEPGRRYSTHQKGSECFRKWANEQVYKSIAKKKAQIPTNPQVETPINPLSS